MASLSQFWHEDDGVLTFEWVLLVTVLVVGVLSGLAAARDSLIDELGDVAQALTAIDQSYRVDYPADVWIHTTAAFMGSSDSEFNDSVPLFNQERIQP